METTSLAPLAYGDRIAIYGPYERAAGTHTTGVYVDRYRDARGRTVYVVENRAGNRYHGTYAWRERDRFGVWAD